MKSLKQFTLTIFLGLFVLCAYSQQESTFWSEGFESGMGDWYVDNGTWEVGIPTSGPNGAHSGTQCAATILNGNYYDNQESRLIYSSWITVPSASENPRLRLWHWYSFSSDDWGKIQIKTPTSGWITVSNTFTGNSSSIWANTFVDLSGYADSLIQIAFLFHSYNYTGNPDVSSGWYIDDIELRTGPFVYNNPETWESGIGDWWVSDGTWEAGEPTSGPNGAYSGTNCIATKLGGSYSDYADNSRFTSPWITVPSESDNPRIRFWHWYSFSTDDYGQVQIKTPTSDWITVSNTITGVSSYIWTNTLVDLSEYADSIILIGFLFRSYNYTGNQDVSSGWYIDDIELRTGPIVFKNPETWELGIGDWWVSEGTWEVGEPKSGPGSSYNGINCLATKLSGNYSDYADDSRFTSPWITVPSESDNPRIRFWHWYNFSTDDHGQVQIKTPTSGWITVSGNFTGNSSYIWANRLIDLTEYADSLIQIGFVFHSYNYTGGADEAPGWYIDDIEFRTGPFVINNPETWEWGIGDWWASDGTWEVGEPTIGPPSAHDGNNCLATRLDWNYSDYADDSRFTSPWITVPPAIENPRLRFWHWFSFSTNDHGKVQIKTPSSSWIDISSDITGNSSGAWTYSFYDLISYTDSAIQIGFLFHSYNYTGGVDESYGWYIDDVMIDDNSNLNVDAGSDKYISYGDTPLLFTSVTGGTTPYTFEWVPGETLSNPSVQNPLASPTTTTTYQLKVTDANGCFRTDKVTVYVYFTLDIQAYLEGPFNGTSMNTQLNSNGDLPLSQPFNQEPWNYDGEESVGSIPLTDIVDWVLIELRESSGDASTAKYYTMIDRQAAFIKSDGSVVGIYGDFVPYFDVPVTQNLYVFLWHRNHLGILSAIPVTHVNGYYSYDYTSSAANIYGGAYACKELSAGVYGMISGDALNSGIVDNMDKNDFWSDQIGLSGYIDADFNMDGVVNDTDKNDFWKPNAGMGSQVR